MTVKADNITEQDLRVQPDEPTTDSTDPTEQGADFYRDLLKLKPSKLTEKLASMDDRAEVQHMLELERAGKKRAGILIALQKRDRELDPKMQAKLPPKPVVWLDDDYNVKVAKDWEIISGPNVHEERDLLGVIVGTKDGRKTVKARFSLVTGERVPVDTLMG